MAQDEPSLWVATLRAVFKADSEVDAIMIADQIKVNGEADLQEDEGDSLDVTQVTQNLAQLSPEETIQVLLKARNACIRTRTKEGYDLGRELDKFAFVLKNRNEEHDGFKLAGYDYAEYLDIATEVLAGGNPIH